MIRSIRRLAGRALRAVLPGRWVRALAKPALVPGFYRRGVLEVERQRDQLARREGLDDDYWAALLRKHAHILDKALQRCDYEPGHSKDYYGEAVEALAHIERPETLNDESVLWAKKKLKEYESLQTEVPEHQWHEPAARDPQCYARLMQVIRSRRSVRSFLDEPVDDETVRKVVAPVNWAPQSCNRQTIKVFAATDPEIVRECMATCPGATCFSESVPCFLCFTADLRPYYLPHEMWMPMVDVSLGVQNCCLAAHTLGLGMTMLTWCQSTSQDEKALRRCLAIPQHFRVVVNSVMGYFAVSGEPPARKSINATCVIVKKPG